MTPSIEEIREVFRRHDLRCTRQRELVYAALAATKLHPTAEDLYHVVHESDPGISLATVYNTIEAFVHCGLTRRISATDGHGPCRFDADTTQHVHISTKEGSVLDVPTDLSDKLLAGLAPEVLQEIERRMGVTVGRLNVQLMADGCGCRARTSE